MLAIVVLCLIAVAVAQPPVPCTAPPQWEADFFDSNEEQRFTVEGSIAYDALYHRERILDEVDEPNERDFYDVIALFDLQVEFVFNFRARNCTRRPLTRPWRDFGIRPNDSSYGEAYIGSSAVAGANVLVTTWGGNFTTPENHTINYVSTWTYLGCIPIQRTSFSEQFGISHLSFYDVTAGIHDPNVFIPRRACLSDYEWENRYILFGKPTDKFI